MLVVSHKIRLRIVKLSTFSNFFGCQIAVAYDTYIMTCCVVLCRYLVLEHVSGGELFDYLVKRGRLMEKEVCAYV